MTMARSFGLQLVVFVLIWCPLPHLSHEQVVGPAGDLGDDLWTNNNYVKDIAKTSRLLNVTNCWICMHMPGHAKGGVNTHGLPYNVSGLAAVNTSHWERNVSHSIFLHLRETATVCLCRKGTGTSSVPLGDWERCKSTIIMPVTCDNHSSSESYQKLDWLTMEQYQFCSFMEGARNWSNQQYNKPFALPDQMWLLCGSHAYRAIPSDWTGTCTLGTVIPVLYKLDSLPHTRVRNKRATLEEQPLTLGGSWTTQLARSLIPPIGIAMNYRDLHLLNNWTVAMFNDTISALKLINIELGEIREVVLQNRYALDIILAAKGGVCALIHSHCCMYIHDFQPNISATVRKMESMIQNNPLRSDGSGTVDIWGALWSWLPDGSWLRSLISIIVTILILLVLLCCCIQCIPSLLHMCKHVIPPTRKDALVSETKSLLKLEGCNVVKTQKEEMWE